MLKLFLSIRLTTADNTERGIKVECPYFYIDDMIPTGLLSKRTREPGLQESVSITLERSLDPVTKAFLILGYVLVGSMIVT